MDEVVSRAITRFTFLATIVVVMCHVDDAMPVMCRTWLVRYLGGSFSDVNVHNFFFISGYLLARVGEDGWWKSTIKKRVHSLLVPYLIWCAIYGLVFHGSSIIQLLVTHEVAPTQTLVSLAGAIQRIFGLGFLTHPADFPLWYIKTLFYFILVFPLTLPFLTRKAAAFFMLIFVLLLARWTLCKYLPNVRPYLGMCFNLLGFVFFLCGAFCSIRKVSFPRCLCRCSPFVPLAIWFAVQTWSFIPYVNRLGVIMGPVGLAVSVFCLLWIAFSSKWNVSENISRSCFFIYAAHMMALHYCTKLNPHALSFMCPSMWYVLLVISIIVICIVVANIIYMITPRMLAVLTGGRISRGQHKGDKS